MLHAITFYKSAPIDAKSTQFQVEVCVARRGNAGCGPSLCLVTHCCRGRFSGALDSIPGAGVQGKVTTHHKACEPHIRSLPWDAFRKKSPVALTMCRSELEVTAIQELADGSLHFSFGALSTIETSSKGHELSSSHGEHISSKSIPIVGRLPSCFRKQSPIPLAAMGKKRRLGGSKASESDTDVSEPSRDSKERSQKTPRPSSSFVKKTPITHHKREIVSPDSSIYSGLAPPVSANHDLSESSTRSMNPLSNGESSKKQGSRSSRGTSQKLPAGLATGTEKFNKGKMLHNSVPKRLPSKFVRRSPVPLSTRKAIVELVSDGLQSVHNGATDASVKRMDLKSLRPKSKFVKRSPIPSTVRRRTVCLKTGGSTDTAVQFDSQSIYSSNRVHGISVLQECDNTSEANNGAKVGKALSESGSLEGTVSVADLPADLSQYKLIELRAIAKFRGLKGYSRLKKRELIELLWQSAS